MAFLGMRPEGRGRSKERVVREAKSREKESYGQYVSSMARVKRGAFEERPMSRADYFGNNTVREMIPRTAGQGFGFRQLMPSRSRAERDPVMAADAAPRFRPLMPETSKRFGLLMANEVPTEVEFVKTVQGRRIRPQVSQARMPAPIVEWLRNLFSGKLFGRRPQVEDIQPWVRELGPVPMLPGF